MATAVHIAYDDMRSKSSPDAIIISLINAGWAVDRPVRVFYPMTRDTYLPEISGPPGIDLLPCTRKIHSQKTVVGWISPA